MSNTPFNVPLLVEKGVWQDWRGFHPGGHGWRHNINLAGISKVAIHHSVTSLSGNAKKDIDLIWKIHQGNGWGGIGYNIIVTSEVKNGFAVAVYVGDFANARAHTPNQKGAFGIRAGYGNNHILGVCVVGTYHTGTAIPLAQRRTLKAIAEELIFNEDQRLPGLGNSWSSLVGHGECDWTQCPAGSFWNRERAAIINVAYPKPPTPPPPQRPEYETTWDAYTPTRPMVATRLVKLYDPVTQTFVKDAEYPAGHLFAYVAGRYKFKDKWYYRTQWSLENGKWHGIEAAALVEPPPPPKPTPAPPIPDPGPDPDPVPPLPPDSGTTPYPLPGEEAWWKNVVEVMASALASLFRKLFKSKED